MSASDRLHFWALGVGRWVLGDFFPRFRGGEVPDPDETYALRLAASNPTAWLTSCRRPTDFTFGRWVLGVGCWVTSFRDSAAARCRIRTRLTPYDSRPRSAQYGYHLAGVRLTSLFGRWVLGVGCCARAIPWALGDFLPISPRATTGGASALHRENQRVD